MIIILSDKTISTNSSNNPGLKDNALDRDNDNLFNSTQHYIRYRLKISITK